MTAVAAENWARTAYREQVATLARVAAKAAMLQSRADDAVAQCGAALPVPDSAARDLGRLSGSYAQLYEQARQLSVVTDLVESRDELCSLLSYHLHMLRDAGDLAFSGRPHERTEPFRRELAAGLGPRATRLLYLAAELRDRAAAPDRPESGWTGHGAPGEFELDDVDLSPGQPE